MRKFLIVSASTLFLALGGAAHAATIADATNDFLPSYTGPKNPDLDVTSFSVTYNSVAQTFLLQSTMAGMIDAALPGFYAIGVNTGTGPNSFTSLGYAGVRFNQVIAVRKDGTANIGANVLAPGSVTIGGNALSVMVPLSLLPTTGFDPAHFAFNIWPRGGGSGNAAISDFAPDNGTYNSRGETSAAPEPATWLSMIFGFGLCGAMLRACRSRVAFAA